MKQKNYSTSQGLERPKGFQTPCYALVALHEVLFYYK